MLLCILLAHETESLFALVGNRLEPLERFEVLDRSLLLPNSLAHAIKLGKVFLLFANKFIEVLQRADASFLHEELYLRSKFQIVDTSSLPCLLAPVCTTGPAQILEHLNVLHQ